MGWLARLFGRKSFGQKLGETVLTVVATTAAATATAIVVEGVIDAGSKSVQRVLGRRRAAAAELPTEGPQAQPRPVA